ncbi:MAG: 7-carboxy-7-deazaguanine synthase QueE [Thiotrichales bacterium]|jgi:7-carboxy-7-deazaguanine synthase|nr:7-carboxy-7-deazaguanine synthase QueE [Thiotrichales bacterium]MBT5499130.1 7-carboxy-7-deazaguanine synthase QueE [Thiotrichales bacterium]MBT5983854.1 7-carboxy-7-deazaguanine synthase QueE [Thiotrichales bacterium]MBT7933243.1 7-carboxy-7-deazaguanine synthase QueE [Thiotrichales bacterium]
MGNSNNTTLNITEIFFSLQGEAREVGLPTVFVRLTGCPLRCNYCDTTYAFKGNNPLTIDHILDEVSKYNTSYVCVTGGEPMAQSNCLELLDSLVEAGYQVSMETSGSVDISPVNSKVSIVMDIKTPSSTEEKQNRYENLSLLQSKDQLKFVIASKSDFDWCCDLLEKNKVKSETLFSPVFESLKPIQLADWILEKQLNVRLQVQLHKILWGDQKGK